MSNTNDDMMSIYRNVTNNLSGGIQGVNHCFIVIRITVQSPTSTSASQCPVSNLMAVIRPIWDNWIFEAWLTHICQTENTRVCRSGRLCITHSDWLHGDDVILFQNWRFKTELRQYEDRAYCSNIVCEVYCLVKYQFPQQIILKYLFVYVHWTIRFYLGYCFEDIRTIRGNLQTIFTCDQMRARV